MEFELEGEKKGPQRRDAEAQRKTEREERRKRKARKGDLKVAPTCCGKRRTDRNVCATWEDGNLKVAAT